MIANRLKKASSAFPRMDPEMWNQVRFPNGLIDLWIEMSNALFFVLSKSGQSSRRMPESHIKNYRQRFERQ
jgi:hypothetical protein